MDIASVITGAIMLMGFVWQWTERRTREECYSKHSKHMQGVVERLTREGMDEHRAYQLVRGRDEDTSYVL